MTDQTPRERAIAEMRDGIKRNKGCRLQNCNVDGRICLCAIDATAALDALLSALPGLGLTRPMPVEATVDMADDGAASVAEYPNSRLEMIEAWSAMIAAAPDVLGATP